MREHNATREKTIEVYSTSIKFANCLVETKKRITYYPRPAVGVVRDISCACEQQQGTILSMLFAVCNVDYIVDTSSSDRIAREHFRFLEHRF